MVIELVSTDVQIDDNHSETLKHPEQFSVTRYLGGGSFGRVVLAKDRLARDSNRELAIKKISVQKQHTARASDVKNVLREVVILYWAKNPQIVKLISVYMDLNNDVEKVPSAIYIVMGYCGVNLVDYMADKILPLEEAADIVYNIARGLNFLHGFDVYHRDLKPNNICIDENDPQFRAKIIDLGYARKKPQDTNEITSKIATVCYRAPENLFGLKYKEKQDVWALGCIFGFLVTSNNIFRYLQRNMRESSGTVKLILKYLGTPPKSFIEQLNENRTDIDQFLWKDFVKHMESSYDDGEGVYTFFSEHSSDLKRGDGIKLMEGMLKWSYDDRISVKGILESYFVADVRDKYSETLPDELLRFDVKSRMDDHEKKINEFEVANNYAGIKGYLFDVIAKDFGYDKYLCDYYSYGPYSTHLAKHTGWCLDDVRTVTVLGTVVGCICYPLFHKKQETFPWKILATGTAIFVSLSVVKCFLLRS